MCQWKLARGSVTGAIKTRVPADLACSVACSGAGRCFGCCPPESTQVVVASLLACDCTTLCWLLRSYDMHHCMYLQQHVCCHVYICMQACCASHLQLLPPHIAEQQPVNVAGGTMDVLLPVSGDKGAVHRQQHLCPVAHAFREGWKGEVKQQSVASPPPCLHSTWI